MKIKSISIVNSFGGDILINAVVGKQHANHLAELNKDKEYELTIEPVKKKRSIDANAYYHVLLTDLSSSLRTAETSCILRC